MKIKDESFILPAPSDERIQWFEKSYRVILPDEYIDFLKNYNGTIPKTNTFTHNGIEYLIERFLCLLNQPKLDSINGCYDLTVILSQLDGRLIEDENLIGMNLIPFAALFAGDFLCLDFRNNKSTPSVAVWYHEESDELNPVTEEVANNITEFFNMLKE